MAAKTDLHQRFIDWFVKLYERETGVAYVFQSGKDGSAVKWLLANVKPKELAWAAEAMFKDKWGRPNASLAILRNNINRWRQAGINTHSAAAHAAMIDEEKRLAAQNELAREIAAQKSIVDADNEAMQKGWSKLHPNIKRQWMERNRHEHGFGNEKSAMRQWWVEEGRNNVGRKIS